MMVDAEARTIAKVGSVAAEWQSVKIRDVTTQITVGFVGFMSHLFRSAGIVVLRGSNVKEGKLDLSDLRFIDAPTHTLWKKSALLAGDILVVRVGYPGTACVVPAGIGQANAAGLVLIRPDRAIVVPEYLVACLNSDDGRRQVQSLLVGGAQQVFNTATAAEFRFLLPQLKEQEAIAEALSDADAAIEAIDALIAKKRDVKQAAMQQLLTGRTRLPGFSEEWREIRLGDLGVTFGGLAGKSGQDFVDGNASYVTFMNVMTNVVLQPTGSESVRIGVGEHQAQLLAGDIIFNGSSETPEEVGFGAAVPRELEGLYLNSFCFGFRPKLSADLDPIFFAYLTRSSVGRDVIRPMAQGSTRYNLAKTNLLDGRFILPPLAEQQTIVVVLSDMDSEIEALVAERDKMRLAKQGMMQELLSGRVRLV